MIYYIFYTVAIYLFIGIIAFIKLNKDNEYEEHLLELKDENESTKEIPESFYLKLATVFTIIGWPKWILSL